MRHTGEDWLETIMNFRLPRWDELPDFELYSDQVISFIEKYLGVLFFNESNYITTSMIHNYVKLQLMHKPEKKRYNRKHIASLITITILKQVLVISDIREGIDFYVQKRNGSSFAYDFFCDELEYSINIMVSEITGERSNRADIMDGYASARMAAYAFASKTLARYILKNKDILADDQFDMVQNRDQGNGIDRTAISLS